jgi:hypothetical protein
VIASENGEESVGLRVFTLLDIFDPCAKGAEGNFVLRFAGYRAGVASDALAVVDYESISHEVGGRKGKEGIVGFKARTAIEY